MNRVSSLTTALTLFLAAAMLAGLGLLIGALAASPGEHDATGSRSPLMRLTDFDLTNPLLECEGADATIGDVTLRPFATELKGLVNAIRTRGGVDQLAVYFRDLNNGPWYGINENLEFSPGRFMKLPISMVLLKEAETDPRVLSRTIRSTLTEDLNASRTYPPARAARPGVTYSIQDLIELMIAGSDDNAAALLAGRLDAGLSARLSGDLGLPSPGGSQGTSLSLLSYSMLFRTLFNASYLSKDASEKLLAWMSRSSFRRGIVAGVPEGIVVANKYGEDLEGKRGEIRQLNDCGIVYYPDSPYLLCIVSKGGSSGANEAAIRDISRFVFSVIDADQRQQARH